MKIAEEDLHGEESYTNNTVLVMIGDVGAVTISISEGGCSISGLDEDEKYKFICSLDRKQLRQTCLNIISVIDNTEVRIEP